MPGAGTPPRSVTPELAALPDGGDEAPCVGGDESEHVVPRVTPPAEGLAARRDLRASATEGAIQGAPKGTTKAANSPRLGRCRGRLVRRRRRDDGHAEKDRPEGRDLHAIDDVGEDTYIIANEECSDAFRIGHEAPAPLTGAPVGPSATERAGCAAHRGKERRAKADLGAVGPIGGV